jgi:nucleotide-binding universal stress UspA family protein
VFNKILVPTDGSDNAMKAANLAVDFARGVQPVEVEIINVYPVITVNPEGFFSAESYQEMLDREAEKITATTLALFENADLKAQVVYRGGDAGAEIARYAEEEGFDLIIMGTRGAGAFSAWVVGSVAQKVVSRASCPVLLVK